MKKYNGVTFDFSGKVAVITGGSSGIFQGVAKGYGEAGAKVAIVDVNMKGAEETKKAIVDKGGTAKVYKCDVSNVSMIVDTVAQIIKDFGKIDVLVNGAGVLYRAKSEEYPEDKWDLVLNVQAKGTFFMCREVGRHMLERGEGGKIINTSSMLAWSGGYIVPSYAAAKAAITQFTKSLCNEWSPHGINVNAIAPGYILTDITRPIHDDPNRNRSILERLPVGRWGDPDDLVGPFLFLGSGAADYIHGTILPVDGGWLAR
ncbi:MAG: SDR family oxidoreductase [Candidatus Latescibacteria bacterium]|nr:SDR family oxidoreductase [Candidatus Latescibacterota bacterium]